MVFQSAASKQYKTCGFVAIHLEKKNKVNFLVSLLMRSSHWMVQLLKSSALLEYRTEHLDLIEEGNRGENHSPAPERRFMNQRIKQNLKSVYDRHAKTRDGHERPEWKNREREYAFLAFRKNGCTRLLEIGAGTGQDSLYFQEKGFEVYAIDLSDEHVKCCLDKGVTAYVMDLSKMAFDSASFDCIYSINCFLHISKSDLQKALEEAHRVLMPKGLFYLGVYGGKDFEGNMKWKDYYDEERFFAFYEFINYKSILGRFFTIVDAREIPLSVDLLFHAFLLKKRC